MSAGSNGGQLSGDAFGGRLSATEKSRKAHHKGATPNAIATPSGVPTGSGALFGGNLSLVPEQPSLGRTLAVVRVYYLIGEKFARRADQLYMAHGSTLLISLDTAPGGPTYASIASGHEDGTISAFLTAVNQAAVSHGFGAIYFAFEHEVDSAPHHVGLGSPAEFISAWDHIHALAESLHLNWNDGGRLHWVWILDAGAYSQGVAGSFWPGAGEVDIVAADGYNTQGCRDLRPGNMVAHGTEVTSPATLFDPVLGFARANGGLPVFIAEWGSVPYTSPAVRAGYIQSMQAYVSANPQIAAALYWNGHGFGNACNYNIDGDPASVAALAAMANSPALAGHVPVVPQ
jgi:hypothetical protein